jgi:mediator of RNA polymerase II transcription subunit 21
MSNSVVYLVTRNSFRQVNPEIPITKTRPSDREDPPDIFEGALTCLFPLRLDKTFFAANKRELVNDLITKAKQIEYLIKSLPPPEPESEQVRSIMFVARICSLMPHLRTGSQIGFS